MSFPYEVDVLNEDINKKLMKDFKGERNGFCQVGPKKWCLPINYIKGAEKYYEFNIRPDDLWIVTYPRSGTTLCQELLWLLNNNLDYEKARQPLVERFPFFEFEMIHSKQFTDEIIKLNNNEPEVVKEMERRHTPGYVFGNAMRSPRHIKSHLPLSLLPKNLTKNCKVFYVARNAKDVAVSYYHHNCLFTSHGFSGDFATYWDYFENDLLGYSPYWDHVKEGYDLKNELLFIFYEDLIQDMPGTINKINKYLEKPDLSKEQMEKLCNHLYIDNFKTSASIFPPLSIKGMINNSAPGFIRRGKVGGNPEYTDEINKKADNWITNKQISYKIPFPL